ncbi:unnamed protein product, partial [Staurois parvus]
HCGSETSVNWPLTSLVVFPNVARGKLSVPEAVTLSYSGLHCSFALGSLQHLPCPALPRCPPCSVPGHLLRPMPASAFRVPFPASVGTYGGWNRGEIQKCT